MPFRGQKAPCKMAEGLKNSIMERGLHVVMPEWFAKAGKEEGWDRECLQNVNS